MNDPWHKALLWLTILAVILLTIVVDGHLKNHDADCLTEEMVRNLLMLAQN